MSALLESMALYEGTMDDIEAELRLVDATLEREAILTAELAAIQRKGAPITWLIPGDGVPCEEDPDLGYSDLQPDKVQAAIRCGACPFLAPCRAHGLAHEEAGIWGGIDVATKKSPNECKRGHIGEWRPMGKRLRCAACHREASALARQREETAA